MVFQNTRKSTFFIKENSMDIDKYKMVFTPFNAPFNSA
jgi:hypothetical protein